MKKLTLALVVTLGVVCTAYSQYMTINYDLEKNYFNEGQPLPAEKTLMFTGLVPQGVDIIEISILPSKAKSDKDRLYLASWKDFDNNANTSYSLAVNYRLKASAQYDFRLDFFQEMSPAAQKQLTEQIIDQVTAYLDANIQMKGKSVTMARNEKKMVADLEEIINTALQDYRNQNDLGFSGLSGTVRQKLANLEAIAFDKLPKDDTAQVEQAQRQDVLTDKIIDLKNVIRIEVSELMSSPWSKLGISRFVDDYETEQKKGTFSLSLGYGGVFLDGKLDNLSYGSSPYAGLAFPLSNSTIAPKFLRNSSLVLGVFFNDFEDQNGNTVSGMIFDKPIYLGLDYKLFEFVRFNAGAVALEKSSTISGSDIITKETFFRPFVGLSARIDLSVGLGK